MRIKRAEITGFGKYHERIFDFEAGNQLLFGNNEVGKSTLYQFLLTMLFGFPKKSRRKDYTLKTVRLSVDGYGWNLSFMEK